MKPAHAKQHEVSRHIPVCRPWAPPAEALLPYLERIDESRWYSNFGPLAREFEAKLAARFAAPTHVVTATNGTLALSLALRARAPEPGLCLMPAWTFVATAHAAHLAGLSPYLADVDANTAALTPDIARDAIKRAPSPVHAIVPVAPQGAPLDLDAWAALEAETGIPVVIDAAAGFDAFTNAPVPIIVSLHATKTLGVGEGGFIASRDAKLIESIRALSVFGFAGARHSPAPAFNAKLSEYAAAVGLAALEFWPQTRARLVRAARLLRAAFALNANVRFQPGWGADWVSAACVAQIAKGADAMEKKLTAHGVETRRWWEDGLHRQPAFRGAPTAGDLSATNALATTSLGLPFSTDLTTDDANAIARAAL